MYPTGNAVVQNGTLLFTDDATVQCVAVNSPNSPDGMSCFSLRLSTDSDVTGLTLSPALATLCVVPTDEGRLLHLKDICIYKKLYCLSE